MKLKEENLMRTEIETVLLWTERERGGAGGAQPTTAQVCLRQQPLLLMCVLALEIQ